MRIELSPTNHRLRIYGYNWLFTWHAPRRSSRFSLIPTKMLGNFCCCYLSARVTSPSPSLASGHADRIFSCSRCWPAAWTPGGPSTPAIFDAGSPTAMSSARPRRCCIAGFGTIAGVNFIATLLTFPVAVVRLGYLRDRSPRHDPCGAGGDAASDLPPSAGLDLPIFMAAAGDPLLFQHLFLVASASGGLHHVPAAMGAISKLFVLQAVCLRLCVDLRFMR